jgi:hypothetical protein
MSRIVRLTESDLTRIVRRVIMEQVQKPSILGSVNYFDTDNTVRFRLSQSQTEHIYGCDARSVLNYNDYTPINLPILDKTNALAYLQSQCR